MMSKDKKNDKNSKLPDDLTKYKEIDSEKVIEWHSEFEEGSEPQTIEDVEENLPNVEDPVNGEVRELDPEEI